MTFDIYILTNSHGECKRVVIELLKFKLAPEHRERFILVDADIWTSSLAKYPGFVDKQVWINPHDQGEVIMIISWSQRDLWKSIPLADLDQINREFDAKFGFEYVMVESSEYEVV